jgi:hypothetical protein
MKKKTQKASPEVLKKIQEAAKKGRIVLAPDDSINEYRTEVNELLLCVGFAGALVTNESRLDDFPVDEVDRQSIHTKFGITVDLGEYVWEVAKKIRASRSAN